MDIKLNKRFIIFLENVTMVLSGFQWSVFCQSDKKLKQDELTFSASADFLLTKKYFIFLASSKIEIFSNFKKVQQFKK